MNPNIGIRFALPKDLPSINEIEKLSFGDEAFNMRQFNYLVRSSSCYFVVADIHNLIGGYLILTTRCNSKMLRIYSLAINPNLRGQGIAKKLIQFSLEFAKTKGYSIISLEVNEANLTAIKLYEKIGFCKLGYKRDYYGTGKHALKMKLHI
jgi:ribosomal protein S18 acetylase RimI-like enzyme